MSRDMNKPFYLCALLRRLKKIHQQDYTGSGIIINLKQLDEAEIGSFELVGESFDVLIPLFIKEVEELLKFKKAMLNQDLTEINKTLSSDN